MRSATTTILTFAVVIVAASTSSEKECVFTDLDLKGALKATLTHLSKYQVHVYEDMSSYGNLLIIECCNVTGLSHLRQYGPLLPYCVKGARKLQVDFLHDDPIEVAMKWWTYRGVKGMFVLGAVLSRFTLQFEVIPGPSENSTTLKLEDPVVSVVTGRTYAVVGDVGEIAEAATEFWSNMLPSLTERAWKYYFFDHLRRAIRDTERDLFNALSLVTTEVVNLG
ncbi:uncharacterized protein LOC119167434 [Rhipicephalus microplus]|uniref:uncharacterized protein LOC119167434 n=1 Tax=Rhipicephalus microplus TaxID=6941 RepID=UPI003F6B7AE6